jgi:iron complex transport system substrate-binding protein
MTRHITPAIAILAIASCVAANAAFAAPVSAKDSYGRSIALKAPVARIVSLSPAATEVIYAIGAGPALVGDTTFCDYPAEALKVAKIGGFASSTISVELIATLKPDLVVSAGTMHAQTEKALAALGIPVFSYDPGDFAAIASDMKALGVLCGKAPEAAASADAMIAAIAKVEAVVSAIPAERRPTVFWEMYDEPLMTCGAATFPHAIITSAGGRDIFSDLPGYWPQVSAEEVIRRAPEFIVGADDHGDKLTVAMVAKRPGWATVPAVRKGNIVLVSANLVSRASPRIAQGVAAVAAALYPSLFK